MDRQALLSAVGTATQTYQRASDGFDDVVGRTLGLNPTDLRCLDWLSQGPLSAGALSEATGLSSAATTTLLDRLEAKGYLRRSRDVEDRRRVLVELTEEGSARIGALFGPMVVEGARLLERFSDRELMLVLGFLRDATAVVDRHTARLRAAVRDGSTPGGG
jgi:DNA-binding MarR family transcriptional regulator